MLASGLEEKDQLKLKGSASDGLFDLVPSRVAVSPTLTATIPPVLAVRLTTLSSVVDVDVDPQLLLQPGVGRQMTAAHLDDAVELIEDSSRCMGVSISSKAWCGAVRAR